MSKKKINIKSRFDFFASSFPLATPSMNLQVITFTCNFKKRKSFYKGRRAKLTETSLNNSAIRGDIKFT